MIYVYVSSVDKVVTNILENLLKFIKDKHLQYKIKSLKLSFIKTWTFCFPDLDHENKFQMLECTIQKV